MKLTGAKSLGQFRLFVRFDNGASGMVDLGQWFEPAEEGAFEQSSISDRGTLITPAKGEVTASWFYLKLFPDRTLDPPVYEIGDFLPDRINLAGKRYAVTLVSDLATAITDPCEYTGYKARESILLPLEIAVCDIYWLDVQMGNWFTGLLELCGGPETYARGLRGLKYIGASEYVEIMEAGKEILQRHGVKIPDFLPNPWWPWDEGLDYKITRATEHEFGFLNARYVDLSKLPDREIHMVLLKYLEANQEELSCRSASITGFSSLSHDHERPRIG